MVTGDGPERVGGFPIGLDGSRRRVFMVLLVFAERRARSPLLRLDLFRNRSFAVVSIITVVGMFSFLGTAHATSIRMGVIQHQSPMRTSVAFVLLGGFALVLPLSSHDCWSGQTPAGCSPAAFC